MDRAYDADSDTIFTVWTGKTLEAWEPFTSYADKPAEFCEEILGITSLWLMQREIMEAVRDHPRVAIAACYASGKTFLAACLLLWWLYTRKPALIITTAPTGRQVKTVLWREVRKVLKKARVRLPGRILQAKLEVGEDMWAMGFASDSPNSVAGLHEAANVLFIEDEAAGMEAAVVEGFEGITTSPNSRHLKIGNPICTAGPFWDCFNNPKESANWERKHISALETPNYQAGKVVCPGLVTREWVETRRKRWGESSPLWITRVLGQFYLADVQKVVPAAWVKAAQERWIEFHLAASLGGDGLEAMAKAMEGPDVLGVDVAGGGQDETVLYHRRGRVLQFVAATQEPDHMKQADWIVEHSNRVKAGVLSIDGTQIGKGLADRLQQLHDDGTLEATVNRVQLNMAASDPKCFAGLLDEIQFAMRAAFDPTNPEAVMIDPEDKQLAEELPARGWTIVSEDGVIRIQRKRDLRKEGVGSPDYADGASLCYAQTGSRVNFF